MPGMQGLELARRLTATWADIRVSVTVDGIDNAPSRSREARNVKPS
jgi:CheY-like chemotaxis protein